jgi:hypothetical protein
MTQEDIEASFGTLLHGAGKIALLVLSHMGCDARDRVCFANLAAPVDISAGLERLPWCYRSKRRSLMEALMGVTFPNESPEYRAARDKLMQREVSLRAKWRPWPRRSEHFRQVGRCPRTTSTCSHGTAATSGGGRAVGQQRGYRCRKGRVHPAQLCSITARERYHMSRGWERTSRP